MLRKLYFSFILFAFAMLLPAASALGQFGAISGVVEMEGTHAPVSGAIVEAYRMDMKQSPLKATTNKKGEFSFVAIPYGTDISLAVSGPNISPTVFSGVRAGKDNIKISVSPGDGKKLTDAEVRSFAKTSETATGGGELSPEERKAKEEYEKKLAENLAERKKAEDTNKLVNAALKEGAAAFEAGNFDLAISKFDEGYRADPDYEGSAPIMLNNKALALRRRAIDALNKSASGDSAAKADAADRARKDTTEALTAFDKSLEVLTKAPATDANAARNKIDALRGIVETHALMARRNLDSSKVDSMIPALDRYLTTETDEKRKGDVLLGWSESGRLGGEMKLAIYGYRKYLERDPAHLDAMAGLGLSLFNEGVSSVPENKEEMQEGLNLMTKFTETAPDTHPLKASVKDAVDYLKNTAKLAPQKVTTPARKRN